MEYLIKQKVFSFLQTFNILDANGNDLYVVKHEFFSFPKKMKISNLAKEELASLQKHFFLNKYDIFVKNEKIGLMRRRFSLRPKFELSLQEKEYTIIGDFFAHDFKIINKEDQEIAKLSKKIFSWGNTYSIVINDNENQLALLAVMIIIDLSCHSSSSSNRRRRGGLTTGLIGTLMDQ